jgi:hypothetical protein
MQRWSGLALVAFTLAMIGAGLWHVGGPEQARAEQRDQRRVDDLLLLAEYHGCLRRRLSDPDLTCRDNPPLIDPLGVPYVVNLEKNLVCTEFETDFPQRRLQARYAAFVTEGCLGVTK